MLSIACPRCGRALRIKDEQAGKTFACPGCKQVFAVRPAAVVQASAGTMSSQDHGQAALEDLVSLWQRRRAEGESPTPAELCRERPDLLPELERRIAVLVQMGALADVTHSTATLDGGGAGKDGELTAFLAPAQAPDELGRLGGYRVLEVLGRGGMGVVFRAEDPNLRRQLALKAMLPTLAAIKEARERFLREARTAASVEHDNVVVIHQVGEDRGVPFLAMPLLRGESLDDRLKREGRLPIGEVLRIGREVAQGLAAAHKRGLIHRDIKPANLWLEEETGRVKVLDFGLARALNAGDQLTRQGAILGTPAYMSPEQGSGEVVDGRSDLFSLGCVLYRMVTGQLPFQGKDAVSTLLSVARDNPPAPSAVNPEVPPALSDFILTMLSKTSTGRPSSAQEVSKALEALRGESSRDSATLQMPSTIPQTDKTSATPFIASARPRRRWAWVAAVAALLIGGGVVAVIVIRIKGPDGKQTEISAPDGSKVTVNDKGEVDIQLPAAWGDVAKPAVAAASPLDKLDPAQIPASERFDWQPKQLVAVLGEHRQRHWGGASGVAVSRDGKRIATTGHDGLIRFWDPATFRETGAVRVVPQGYAALAPVFSPDGKRLAVADWPGVAFYDLSGAEPVREKMVLEAGGEGCCRLAFTPDGKRLIGPDNGGTLYLWDLASGQTKPAWKRTIYKTGYHVNPTPFALSDDGRTLACFSDAKTATLLDVSGAEPREILAVPLPSAAWSLALSPDAKRLAVGFQDRKIRFWSVSGKTPEQPGEIDFGPEPGVLRFSPDGKRLAGAYTQIRLWDFERKAWIAETPNIHGACTDFSFALDGQALIAACGGGAIHFWGLSGEKLEERSPIKPSTYLPAPANWYAGFSPDGKRLATGDLAGFGWWNLDRASPAKLREMAGRLPFAVSPDGKQMLRGWGLAWCDLTSDQLRESEEYGQVQDAYLYRLLPDGETVLVGTRHGEVLFVKRGAERKLVERSRFRAGGGSVRNLEVSPDGRMLATCTESGMAVKLWDLTGDKPVLRDALSEGRQIYHIVFSPDSRLLAVSDTFPQITLWDVQNRPAQQRRHWQVEAALAVAFSPDGRTLACAGNQGKLTLRDIETGETRHEWQLPGPINYVTYAPDGRHLLTINSNGTGYILRLVPSPSARVDDAWLKQVAALQAEKQVEAVAARLKELNPGFDGKVTPTIENSVVTDLSFFTDSVTDISPVRALTGLKRLSCGGSAPEQGRLSDLSPLKDMKLTFLQCVNNGELSDLSPLRGLKLTFLNIGKTQVSDLSPLKDMKLTGLICYWSAVSDLSPLKGMSLSALDCHDTKVSDLSPLKGMPLKSITCDFKPERDAEILRAIPTLETINDKSAKDFWKEVEAKRNPKP